MGNPLLGESVGHVFYFLRWFLKQNPCVYIYILYVYSLFIFVLYPTVVFIYILYVDITCPLYNHIMVGICIKRWGSTGETEEPRSVSGCSSTRHHRRACHLDDVWDGLDAAQCMVDFLIEFNAISNVTLW